MKTLRDLILGLFGKGAAHGCGCPTVLERLVAVRAGGSRGAPPDSETCCGAGPGMATCCDVKEET